MHRRIIVILTSVEILILFMLFIHLYDNLSVYASMQVKEVHWKRDIVWECTHLSMIWIVILFDIVWIRSYDKDYPTITKLWMVKETLQLFALLTFAFVLSIMHSAHFCFIPALLVIVRIVAWRGLTERKEPDHSEPTATSSTTTETAPQKEKIHENIAQVEHSHFD